MINFESFLSIFNSLPDKFSTIVFHLIQNMEHTENVSLKDIDYRRGFNIALREHDLSINDLAKLVEKKIYDNAEPKGTLRDGIATLIERGHRNSSSIYLKDVCEILEIDETFLINNSEYMYKHTQDIKWCFETLSPINQSAIYSLVLQLNSIESFDSTASNLFVEHPNIGIE